MPKSAKPGNMKGVSWNSHPGGRLFKPGINPRPIPGAGPRRFRKEGGRGLRPFLGNLPMGRSRWTNTVNNSALLYLRIGSQQRPCLLVISSLVRPLLWQGSDEDLAICFEWKLFRGGERGRGCRRFGRCTDSAEGDQPPPRASRVKWYHEQRRNSRVRDVVGPQFLRHF